MYTRPRLDAYETNDGNSSGYDVKIDRAEVNTASYYKVVSVLSGQDLSVSYCSTTSGEPIVQWDDSNGTCQQWEVTPATRTGLINTSA